MLNTITPTPESQLLNGFLRHLDPPLKVRESDVPGLGAQGSSPPLDGLSADVCGFSLK
jgi:hypothetical protein